MSWTKGTSAPLSANVRTDTRLAYLLDARVAALLACTQVLAFNLACEVLFVGFWHYLTYVSAYAMKMQPFKFNPINQYVCTWDDRLALALALALKHVHISSAVGNRRSCIPCSNVYSAGA